MTINVCSLKIQTINPKRILWSSFCADLVNNIYCTSYWRKETLDYFFSGLSLLPCSLSQSYRLFPCCCCCLARYLALAESIFASLLLAVLDVVVVFNVAAWGTTSELLLSLQAFRLLPTLSANPSPGSTAFPSANDDSTWLLDGCECCSDCDSGCNDCIDDCPSRRPLRQ